MKFPNKFPQVTLTKTALVTGILLSSLPFATAAATAATLAYDVTGVEYGPLTDGTDTTVNGVTYLNQSLPIKAVTANSLVWELGSFPQPVVTLRRGGYAPADNFGNYSDRQLVLSEGILGQPTTVRTSLPTTTQALLNQNNILQGAENLFVNAGLPAGPLQELQTDVERADFVFQSGITISPILATVFFDRGLVGAHDGFKIAPILSVDAAGNPTHYGSLLSIATGWGTPNLRPGGGADNLLPYPELTNSTGDFRIVNTVTQKVGGILLPFSLFSDTPTTIYGYSLFAPDVTDGGNPANLLDWKNSTYFPQATPNAIGGLDLLAGSGQVAAVPEPTTVLGFLVGGSLLAALKRKKVA
ncbi:MAG: PEP-CTERM sorting domain-containing protein [Leptolyngbyaceae cyanobacterium bins.349]|nr:PEP-CTERM sorting domain-containing protein [Leptolyngbyaceae cyanobacterium bins.349]